MEMSLDFQQDPKRAAPCVIGLQNRKKVIPLLPFREAVGQGNDGLTGLAVQAVGRGAG
jgi:hypothetical protein